MWSVFGLPLSDASYCLAISKPRHDWHATTRTTPCCHLPGLLAVSRTSTLLGASLCSVCSWKTKSVFTFQDFCVFSGFTGQEVLQYITSVFDFCSQSTGIICLCTFLVSQFACIGFLGSARHIPQSWKYCSWNCLCIPRCVCLIYEAFSNNRQSWCRHQAGVETPLRRARNHLTCTLVSNPTQELHTERQAPKRSTVEKSAVGAILLHCPAVSFPPARMMPVKLMRWKYSMFRWKRLFIIGASATVTHCAVYLGGRGCGGGRCSLS